MELGASWSNTGDREAIQKSSRKRTHFGLWSLSFHRIPHNNSTCIMSTAPCLDVANHSLCCTYRNGGSRFHLPDASSLVSPPITIYIFRSHTEKEAFWFSDVVCNQSILATIYTKRTPFASPRAFSNYYAKSLTIILSSNVTSSWPTRDSPNGRSNS